MSSRETRRTVRLSVLDRLQAESGRSRSLSQSVKVLRESVRRDLDWLLNTRQIPPDDRAGDEYPEVQKSLYHYGLRDITSLSGDSEHARGKLLRWVEESIELFEPRLMKVRVTAVEAPAQSERRQIRFHIEGLLKMDPDPERVTFDTTLETSSGKIEVTGESNA